MELKNSPAYKPERFKKFEPIWQLIDTVWDSLAFPDDMRRYLKKKPEESQKDYNARLEFSALENRYRPTITSNAAPLSAYEFTEDVPETIRRFESDIDGGGTNLATFLFNLAEMLMKYDSIFILAESQQSISNQEIRTEQDLRISGKRPVLKLVGIKGLQNGRVDENQDFQQLVFCHNTLEPDGDYGEKEQKQYWRYQPGSLTKYVIDDESKKAQQVGEVVNYVDARQNPFTEIPMVWVSGSKRPKLDLGVPYFLTLAKLNVQHLIKTSELDDIEFKCNNPTPKRKWPNRKPDNPPKLILGKVIECEMGGDVEFLEPTGAAISSTHGRNLDRETKMDRIGQAFLSGGENSRTATEARIDMAQSVASLKGFAEVIESAMQEAFRLWTLYSGETTSGGIQINKDVLAMPADPGMVRTIIDGMVQQGYSRRYALLKLQEIGFQPKEVDIDEELNQPFIPNELLN